MVGGCCTGAVVPSWWPLGLTYPPNTVPFAAQVSRGLLEPSASMSLPVHSLPAYFAALGLALAAIEAGLLRRGARRGTAAAVGLVSYPLGQLVIEQIRLPEDSRGPVMVTVLAGMAVAAAGVVVALRLRSRFGERWRSDASTLQYPG